MDLSLRGWLPVLAHPGPPVTLEWCHTDGRLGEPFFEESAQRWVRHPFNAAFRRGTDLATVVDAAVAEPGVPLAGIILHQSRCGSTLLASLLGAAGVRILSEPGVLDSVARAPGLADEDRAAGLASLTSVLSRTNGPEQVALLKLDSWATRSLHHYRRAFPGVPLVFVYRDPTAVVVSQLGRRAAHTVPGALPASLFGASQDDLWGGSAADGVARVVAAVTEPVLDLGDEVRLVRYDDLPAIAAEVAGWFGIGIGPDAVAVMAEVAGRDAKNPVLAFVPDGEAKDREATPEVRAAVDRWLTPLHERLDAERARQRQVRVGP